MAKQSRYSPACAVVKANLPSTSSALVTTTFWLGSWTFSLRPCKQDCETAAAGGGSMHERQQATIATVVQQSQAVERLGTRCHSDFDTQANYACVYTRPAQATSRWQTAAARRRSRKCNHGLDAAHDSGVKQSLAALVHQRHTLSNVYAPRRDWARSTRTLGIEACVIAEAGTTTAPQGDCDPDCPAAQFVTKLTTPVKSGRPKGTKSGFLYVPTIKVSAGTSSMKHRCCPSVT